MSIQIFPASGGTASFNGIFIPRGDLAPGGVSADAEFASGEPAATKRDKALYAILTVMSSEINSLNALDRLGVAPTVANINSATHTVGLTTQRVVFDDQDAKPAVVPVPSSGANNGRGDFAFTDLFANAVKVASAASITEAGVLIEAAPLVNHGAPAYASIDLSVDSRLLAHAIVRDFVTDTTNYPTRSTTAASAITARSAGTSSEIPIPAAYIAGTDPTSGLVSADVYKTHLLSSGAVTMTFDTLKVLTSGGTQSWELNSVTA